MVFTCLHGKLSIVIRVKTTLNATEREECNLQRLALCLAESEFTCFSVPVKQLKPSPARMARVSSYIADRKLKIDDEYPDNFDLSPRIFSFDL